MALTDDTDLESDSSLAKGPASPVTPSATGSRIRLVVVALIVLGALGFLIFKGLGNATVYFKTADEAVAQRASLGSRRFRVEGTVVPASVQQSGNNVRFRIENKAAVIDVVHTGDPPELFRPGIPVVLEGHFAGAAFASDRIMVKHTSAYRTKNPTRVRDYPTSP